MKVVLENVVDLQLVKIFPTFFRTPRFSTAFTTVHLCPYSGSHRSCPHIHII